MNQLSPTQTSGDEKAPAVSMFGYDLIRDILIPELLGKDTKEILYWAGKRLARRFPLHSIDELIEFFDHADWGILTVKNESKNTLELNLEGKTVSYRLQNHDCTFQLEAGFIAQQLEQQKKVIVESYEHPSKRKEIVQFTVKWDSKDSTL